jgi:hypothetical protein
MKTVRLLSGQKQDLFDRNHRVAFYWPVVVSIHPAIASEQKIQTIVFGIH